MIIACLLSLHFLLLFGAFAIYAERKTAAFIQDRLGPYEVGPYGLLQPLADILKLLQKEDLCPTQAVRSWFRVAPALPFLAVLCTFACLPLFPGIFFLRTPVGVLLVLALLSLNVLGVVLAGWAAKSKFSIYGAFRSLGQLIAYEVPLGFTLVAVVLISQSMDFVVIAEAQRPQPADIGGIFTWNFFTVPILIPACIIFFICTLAQGHRTPFDLADAESELVAGYHTEYSGFRWSLFMLAEYGTMFVLSFLLVWLFLGAGYSPLPNMAFCTLSDWTNDPAGQQGGWFCFWMLSKTWLIIWLQMWIRWSLPRLRLDQVLRFCWCYLTPVSIILVYLSALWVLL